MIEHRIEKLERVNTQLGSSYAQMSALCASQSTALVIGGLMVAELADLKSLVTSVLKTLEPNFDPSSVISTRLLKKNNNSSTARRVVDSVQAVLVSSTLTAVTLTVQDNQAPTNTTSTISNTVTTSATYDSSIQGTINKKTLFVKVTTSIVVTLFSRSLLTTNIAANSPPKF